MPLQKRLATVPRVPRDTAEADACGLGGLGMVRHGSVEVGCSVGPVTLVLAMASRVDCGTLSLGMGFALVLQEAAELGALGSLWSGRALGKV